MAQQVKQIICPRCNGEGFTYEVIETLGCCKNPLFTGECCGNGVPVQEQEAVQCMVCMGTGKVDGDDDLLLRMREKG
jgi:DnaJ-class molecular chaperone